MRNLQPAIIFELDLRGVGEALESHCIQAGNFVVYRETVEK